MTNLNIGDQVTPAKGPWHGLVGKITSTDVEFFGVSTPAQFLVEFEQAIENHKGLPVWDHWFEPEELIKLDEAGKLIYV